MIMTEKFRSWIPTAITIILIGSLFIYFNYKIDNLETIKEEKVIMKNNFSKNVEKIKPAVVMILAETNRSELPFMGGEYIASQNKVFSKGTGFIVTENGYILTANHVVKEAKDKIQVYQSGKLQPYEAKIISSNNDSDVALLKIEGNRLPHVVLGEYDKFAEGLDIGFIGFPLIMNSPITNKGIISGKGKFQFEENGEYIDIYTVDAFINQGNSGGPVFSADTGEVIGIINARYASVNENQFLKLPSNYSPVMTLGDGDPIRLSVETYNANLRLIGDVTQVGIGYTTSIEYGKGLLEEALARR
jgi:S1-C subfamily serine protease